MYKKQDNSYPYVLIQQSLDDGEVLFLTEASDASRVDCLAEIISPITSTHDYPTLTLDCLAEIVSPAFLVDDVLVDLARRYVVVSMERDVEESLVVAKVKVDLPAVVKHEHLACRHMVRYA